MKPDTRPRAMASGGLWGGNIALVQAAFATDPFMTLTSSTIALSAALLIIYLIDGKLDRRAQERQRSWQSN